jgi:hypothetical protein
MQRRGRLAKMVTSLGETVQYHLPLGEQQISLNDAIGSPITLRHEGTIHCVACGRSTKKSYSQGHCYPCSQKLASCDLCIMRPETCHYAKGTCREPEWGEANCITHHFVYLANTSGLKVGITRGSQIPTRWMDQGATQALPIFRVANRLLSGLVEVICKSHVADRTDWRLMLKGEGEVMDLAPRRDELLALCDAELQALIAAQGDGLIERLPEADLVSIHYPVKDYPARVTALNLDKTPVIKGVLQGIKGQYLILDSGVLNVRKYGGYDVSIELPGGGS